jgi:hypothetical protein
MSDQPLPFDKVMANRIADRERRDARMKAKGSELIRSVLLAELATLPADVRTARVELEAEAWKEPTDGR